MLVRGGKNKATIASKVVAGVVVLAIFTGLGIVTRADAAASTKPTNELLLGEMSLFDPFTLESTSISANETEENSGTILLLRPVTKSMDAGVKARPPIRIPYRPPLRSPFRPPL